VGKPTVSYLSKLVDPRCVYVATRDPSAEEGRWFSSLGVNVVPGDLSDVDSVRTAFAGAFCAYIICPGVEERATLACKGIEAAVAAGVRHIVLQSVSMADCVNALFGRQFHEAEVALKKCGIPFTIIRLPLFTENILLELDFIRDKSKIFGTMSPDVKCSTISGDEIGQACAVVLANPNRYTNQILHVCGPMYSKRELAESLSGVMGKKIEYEQLSSDSLRKAFLDKGLPAWLVTGLLELFRAADAGALGFADDDFVCLTGQKPLPIHSWVQTNKALFFEPSVGGVQ